MFKKWLILFIAWCIYYSGMVKFARWRMQRRPGLIILNYHRAAGGDLRRHLLYLRRHYRMLHLEEALEELYAQDTRPYRAQDRRTPLVLTFDDGYRDNYTHAFTLARDLHVPITIFLVPGYIESGQLFWWLEPAHLVRCARVETAVIEGRTYYLRDPDDRFTLTQAIDARVRYASSVIEREHFLTQTREALKVSSELRAEDALACPLNWLEIQEMEASGWVSFGAHTVHHPVLGYLRDPAEIRSEVEVCRSILEKQLGRSVRTFAYPLGRMEHIGQEGVRAAQEAGYKWALTTIYGINTPESNPYQLRRVVGLVNRHWLIMAAEITGVWQSVINSYHMLRGQRKKPVF